MRASNRLFLLLVLTVCAPAPAAADESPFAGIDLQAVPGADFFAYANGAWLKQVEIPADRASYGIFDQLEEVSDQRTADLIQAVGSPHLTFNTDPVHFIGSVTDVHDTRPVLNQLFDLLGTVTTVGHAKDLRLEDELVLHIQECLL